MIAGDIIVDGIPISKVPISTLRARMAVIPQDPTIFGASLRSNLDPFGRCQDVDIWDALDAVRMKVRLAG